MTSDKRSAFFVIALAIGCWFAISAKPRRRWIPAHRDTLTESISGRWAEVEGRSCR